jgi:hypothetical protein
MKPITFPLEALLNPVTQPDRLPGVMVWSGQAASTSAPDAFWLESHAPSRSFRLAWSREGRLMGDARWTFSARSTTPSFDAIHEVTSTLGVDQLEVMGPELSSLAIHETEFKERVERICKFARTRCEGLDCVVFLDPLSWKEVQHFAKTEGAALDQAVEIADWQNKLLGPTDRSLSDHQKLAQSAQAAQFAQNPEQAVAALQGGSLRRALAAFAR